MERKKIIVIGSGVAVILLLIIWMISNAMKEGDVEETKAPTLGGNSEITIEEMMKAEGNQNENYQVNNESEVVSEEDIKNAILSNSGNSAPAPSQQESQSYSQNYNPYGDRDMYTTYNHKTPPRQSSIYEDYTPQPAKSNVPTIERAETQSKYSKKGNGYINQKYISGNQQQSSNNSLSNNRTQSKVYKAVIMSTRNKYITQENNRVQIRVIEPFSIGDVTITKGSLLTAYASFGNDVKLKIKSIFANGKSIPVDISILDSQGQESIEVIGGTGADTKDEIENTATSSVSTGSGVVDKAVSIFKGKKKAKVMISSDFVYLQIN